MRNDTFTPAETEEFIRLLKKIQENGYWTPDAAWIETIRTFGRYACELVVIDHSNATPRILLTRYTGNTMPSHQKHFHIPGGFARANESIEETCSRVAQEEIGVDVKFGEVLNVHKWTPEESEAGVRPLSLYTLCIPKGDVPFRDDCRFFTREEIHAFSPDDMITFHPHRVFAEKYLQKFERDK